MATHTNTPSLYETSLDIERTVAHHIDATLEELNDNCSHLTERNYDMWFERGPRGDLEVLPDDSVTYTVRVEIVPDQYNAHYDCRDYAVWADEEVYYLDGLVVMSRDVVA